jgi:hypothetical protein
MDRPTTSTMWGVLTIERIEGGDGFFKARTLFEMHIGNMQSLQLAASPACFKLSRFRSLERKPTYFFIQAS